MDVLRQAIDVVVLNQVSIVWRGRSRISIHQPCSSQAREIGPGQGKHKICAYEHPPVMYLKDQNMTISREQLLSSSDPVDLELE